MHAARAARPDAARVRSIALEAAGIGVAILIFWVLRVRHLLLGDAMAVIEQPPGTGGLHGFEPLISVLQRWTYDLIHALSSPTRPVWQITWTAVAVVSVAAGALFVPVAWRLAGEIEANGPIAVTRSDAGSTDSATPRHARSIRTLAFVILVFQGYAELFCGYVENYAPLLLANGVVLLTGLRFARGRGSLLAAGAAIVLAVGLHFSAAALLPAWLLLAIWGMTRAPDRRRARRDFGLMLLLALALTVALAIARPGYLLPRSLWSVAELALGGRQEDPQYLLSLAHLRDFANEQLLIGPLGLLAFLGGVVVAGARGAWRRADGAFAIAAGAGYGAVSLLAGESNLGYARNWDLLAPAGVIFTGAGLLLIRPLFQRTTVWRNVLLLGAALSLFHTVPWLFVNASESRGVRWFEKLPLGRGRTESTLGLWYELRGRFDLAERWLIRSLERNPANTRAHYFLGEVYLATGRPERACAAFAYALRLRPDKDEFRLELARALALSGRWLEARGIVEEMMRRQPNRASLWALDAILLRGNGLTEFARAALERAVALEPRDSLYARLRGRMERGEEARRALIDEGARLVWR